MKARENSKYDGEDCNELKSERKSHHAYNCAGDFISDKRYTEYVSFISEAELSN